MNRSLLILCPFLVLASCAAPPASRSDEIGGEIPETWDASKTAQAGVDRSWIDRFADTTLMKLVDEALENNRDLKASAARIDRAEGVSRSVGADLKPQIEASLFGGRDKQSFIGFPVGSSGPDSEGGESNISSSLSNRFGTSLDVNWELDVWGRIRSAVSASLADVQASQADFRAAETSLAAQVAKTWFALVEANELVDLGIQTVAAFKDTESSIRSRFELGQGDESASAAQLRLAMSDTASASAALEQQRENAARTGRQLEILLGRYPSGELKAQSTLPEVPPPPPAGLPSELLQRRPDIIAAERRFAASGARIKEARRAMYPRFALTGSVGTATEDLNEILNSDFGVWSLAGNIAQPIYLGGRIRAESDIRIAENKENLALLQETVLQGFFEVETALAIDEFLRKREDELKKAVTYAEEAYNQSNQEYRDGIGDFLTLITTQTRLLDARASRITATRARLDNRINLHLALGGDFRPRKS
jgi:multidrug efflux system outer membrane protein